MPAAHDRHGHRNDTHVGDDVVVEPADEPADGPSAAAVGGDPGHGRRTARRGADPAAALLRQRLAAVAGFLAVFHLAFAVIKLTGPAAGTGFTSDAPAWSLLVRSALDAVAFAALRSSLPFDLRRLRFVEVALFGIEMAFILSMQYLSTIDLIDHRDLVDAVAVQKNGVIRTLVLMICCGVFLPRPPAVTARITVTMAVALIICHGLVLHHADTAGLDVNHVAGHQIVMANALFLVMGVVLSALAAWMLEGVGGQRHAEDRVGPYRLLRLLDAGGTADVHLAEHDVLKRPCAVKIARPGSGDAALRFDREVRAAARLTHPNTVTILDGGRTDDGRPFCVMEYLPGLSVADIVRRSGPMPAARAVHLARQACGALDEAHRVGFVHRDLSPANVFAAVLGGRCDVAKVLDFGAVAGREADLGRDPATAGTVAGTPEYVSPEQAVAGGVVDGRADVYGLGALLCFMVTGRPPFDRGSPAEVLRAHVSEAVPSLRERAPQLPADLEAVILRCLQKRPEDRYADVRAVATALAACGCAADWDEARAERWWLEETSTEVVPDDPLR